jgi:DNA-binding transcriptional ArsR family regulator
MDSGSPEDEIYSIMFSSLKHPIRRKILRMLGSKPMTFMELVEELGISTPNLTYHLESLGELIVKLENGQYKLSAFGQASVSAMQGVEDVHTEPKRRWMGNLKQRAIFGAMLIAIILLSSFTIIQFTQNAGLLDSQQALESQNRELLAWGIGTDKVANFIRNVTHIDTQSYTVSMLKNNVEWQAYFGGVSDETATYSLAEKASSGELNIQFRFRNGHFSKYDLTMVESAPIMTQNEPNNVILNAHGILSRYRLYSGDAYLTDMLNVLAKVNATQSMTVTEGHMKLAVTISGPSSELQWMYTDNGIDYQAKGLDMIFQNNILITMTDGYFLFNPSNAAISVTQEQAIKKAEDYVKTLSWNIEGQQVSNFKTVSLPTSVEMVPHTRGSSVDLYPYWYVVLSFDQIYAGGINEVGIGIYADTGQVADVQMLRGNIL